MTNKTKCVNHKNIVFKKYFNYRQTVQKHLLFAEKYLVLTC